MDYVPRAFIGVIRSTPSQNFGAPHFVDLTNSGFYLERYASALKNAVIIGGIKTEFYGNGQIRGVTKDKNGTLMPHRRVRLFDFHSALLVAECFSDENGQYQFDKLDTTRLYVLNAHDHLRDWEGVIADYTAAEEVEYP